MMCINPRIPICPPPFNISKAMYKFVYEHAARTFAYQQGQNGWDTIVTESEGYWWVEVL